MFYNVNKIYIVAVIIILFLQNTKHDNYNYNLT